MVSEDMALSWALMQATFQSGTTWRRAAAIWAELIEVFWLLQDILSIFVLLASHWKAIVDVAVLLEKVKERLPG